ncbi:MAG: MarR family winged helix-turn-helix transcriptional regulator [Caulobacteraceae bacterium]
MPKPHRPSVPALDRSPSHLLHRALQLALDIYTVETGPVSLTQRQYAVLSAVAAQEGLTQTDLVRATGIDRSTLADMAARLIAKGYLVRERSASDARANAVNLTVEGRAVLEAARPRVEAADLRILELLGAKKREPFVDALRRLAKAGESALLPDVSGGDKKSKRADDEANGRGKKHKGGKKKKKARLQAEVELEIAPEPEAVTP